MFELEKEKKPEQLVLEVPLWKVEPNRNQPRKHFDEDALNDLAESIKLYGIIEPIVVRKETDYYSIIAGERRWRAARKAGLSKIPVIVRSSSKQEAADIALIENIQREDLNPIEEAIAYKTYCTEFGVTQEVLAEKLSKGRATIANSMRLLNLPEKIQEMIASGELSSGHGKTLLSIKDENRQLEIADYMVKNGVNHNDEYLEKEITQRIGMKVNIARNAKKNILSIEFYDDDELNDIYERLTER